MFSLRAVDLPLLCPLEEAEVAHSYLLSGDPGGWLSSGPVGASHR